jgi:hypothetical protein
MRLERWLSYKNEEGHDNLILSIHSRLENVHDHYCIKPSPDNQKVTLQSVNPRLALGKASNIGIAVSQKYNTVVFLDEDGI